MSGKLAPSARKPSAGGGTCGMSGKAGASRQEIHTATHQIPGYRRDATQGTTILAIAKGKLDS